MSKFRVLMEDSVNGKPFNFAIFVEVETPVGYKSFSQFDEGDTTKEFSDRVAERTKALSEFPEATVIEIRLIEPTLHELLEKALLLTETRA